MKVRFALAPVGLLLFAVLLAACGGVTTKPVPADSPATTAPEVDATPTDEPSDVTAQPEAPILQPGKAQLLRADVQRDTAPQVDSADLQAHSSGNAAFAFDLYQRLRAQEGNVIYSPYSISVALAMTFAGANSTTAQQMAGTLHFALPQEKLHPAFNALGLALDSRNSIYEDPASGEKKPGVQLDIANALWAQIGYPFKQPFLDTLGRNYDAGVQQVDFQNAPEPAREAINQWASEKTKNKIQEVVPQGAITPHTRLVLANAIYLNALWQFQFDEAVTQDEPFNLLDGTEVQAQMMRQQESFGYATGDGYQAVDLPYWGGQLSMLAIVPDQGTFAAFESSFDATRFEQIRGSLAPQLLNLGLPRFEFDTSTNLSGVLAEMGMPEAFTDQADFSGMADDDLAITDVLHKAYIKVYESGTEAAAVTAVVVGVTSVETDEPVSLTIDRPFVFVLYDHDTGAILFVGRVLNPAG